MSLDSKFLGLDRIAHSLLALFIIYNFLILVPIFISHLLYPFPLEWVEGGIVDQCLRILQGKAIYAEPSADFMAFVYTPLYFYLGTLLMKFLGEGFFALRLLSILGFLGSSFLIYRIVVKESSNRLAAWVSSGLFAASFGVVGYWYDLARVDSLAMFLLLLSGYALRYWPGAVGALVSAVVFCTAFLAKQSALFFFPFMIIPLLFGRRREALVFGLGSVLLCIAPLIFLGIGSQGWSWFYFFKIPAATPRLYRSVVTYPIQDLLGRFPILLVVALLIFHSSNSDEKNKMATGMLRNFWFWFFLGGFLASFCGRLKYGGWDNVLYSVVAVLSLLFGIILGQFWSLGGSQSVRRLIPGLLILQFLLLLYDPFPRIPTKEDRRGGEILVGRIGEIPGRVLVFYHSHLSYMATGETSASAANLKDLPYLYDSGVPFVGMPNDMYQAIVEKKYAAVILDDRAEHELRNPWTKFISQYYSFSEPIYKPGEPRLRFMTGLQSIPRFIYRPRAECESDQKDQSGGVE